MTGFVKLYGDRLLGSSLMDEAIEARWLFMCLLGKADENGYVRCQTVGAAARLANLTEDQAARALEALSSPDPKSTTPDHEGRRILHVEGGWTVVNHSKYREMRTERQIRNAGYQTKHREKDRLIRQERQQESGKGSVSLSASVSGEEKNEPAGAGSRDVVAVTGIPCPDAGVAGFHRGGTRPNGSLRGGQEERPEPDGELRTGVRPGTARPPLSPGDRGEFRGDPPEGYRRAGPPNPFVQGRRETLELELQSLVRREAELTDRDGAEVMAEVSHYEGARTSKLNPATMSDDRLLNSLLDARARIKRLEEKRERPKP